MESVKEVVAVCGSILDTVSKIANVKEDWFTVSVDYQSEATILRSKLDYYEEQVRIHQQPVDSTMMKILKKAELTLKRAEARLSKLEKSVYGNQCCSQFWWLYAKVSLTLFPEKLEKTFQMVIQELGSVSKNIKEEVKVSGLMREAGKNRAIPTDIHNNGNKYVPIEKSQSAVIKAIEDSQGEARMILLYGGVGKGKSTLARYICELYGQSGEKNSVFDHVIFVPCGNSSISDLAAKQYEILEHLSPTSLTEESSSKSGENVGSKSRIAKALHNFFIGKKILMVLDGVSDKQFLYEMWKVARDGKDDKILVTSQRSNLCEDVKDVSVLITMEDASKEEARNILASLVGLEGNKFPENIQEYAEKMIEATDGNPLALACLASTFSYNADKQNKRAWRDAWMGLSESLGSKDTTIVLGHRQDDESAAPRSLWGAMTLCLESFQSMDAKCILFLMYACKGECVPEEVLRLLCAGRKMSSASFTRSIGELEMRELLKRKADTLTSKMNLDTKENEEDSPAWSLQSLVKRYVEGFVRKEEVRDMIGALLGDDSFSPESSIKCKLQDNESEREGKEIEIVQSDEMRVRITLCALYFDGCHTDSVVTGAMSRASEIANLVDSDDTMKDLRRKAMEPLIWLLEKPEVEEQWTEMDKCRVRKVLLNFICNRKLDDDNITYLLKLAACPSAQLATLSAITHISSIEDTPLLNEPPVAFLQSVVDLLKLEGLSGVQEAASKTLRDVCWKAAYDNSAILVGNTSGVLDVLVHSLTLPVSKSDALAENAASALSALAFSKESEIKRVIVNKEGLLAILVNCLYQHSKPTLREQAARALANLAHSTDHLLGWRIVDENRALVGLVNCMSYKDCPGIQTQAARALGNLACSKDDALKLRVAHEEGALVGLVNCLSQNDHQDLQEIAAWALGSVACSIDDALKLRVAHEGALVGLVNCLSQNDHQGLRKEAPRALGNLASSRDDALKLRVAHEEGALVGLVNCLSQNDHQGLRKEAAWALRNLACSRDDALKLRVANEEGALVGLVNCLSQNDHQDLQEIAAWALGSVACSTNDALKLRVAHEEGALVGLVNCLSQNDHQDLQQIAAWALGSVACSTNDALKLRVAHEEGALVGLVNCLSQNDHQGLRKEAARALRNLACSRDDALKLRVAMAMRRGLWLGW